MTPLTSSTTTRPIATPPAVRPSAASDCARDRSPGLDPGPEQPQPDPGGDEDRGQLEQTVRQDQAEEQAAAVVADHDRRRSPRGSDVLEQHVETGSPSTPKAMQSAATQALLVHTCAAKCEAADSW